MSDNFLVPVNILGGTSANNTKWCLIGCAIGDFWHHRSYARQRCVSNNNLCLGDAEWHHCQYSFRNIHIDEAIN